MIKLGFVNVQAEHFQSMFPSRHDTFQIIHFPSFLPRLAPFHLREVVIEMIQKPVTLSCLPS